MYDIKISREERDALLRLTQKVASAISPEDEPTKPVEYSAARPIGLHCEGCGREIMEREKYFVSEESIASITLESNGGLSETKDRAWQTQLLCMKCHNGNETIVVNDHYREVEDC